MEPFLSINSPVPPSPGPIFHPITKDLSSCVCEECSARCFKQIWKVENVGKVGKVGKAGKVGKVVREGR